MIPVNSTNGYKTSTIPLVTSPWCIFSQNLTTYICVNLTMRTTKLKRPWVKKQKMMELQFFSQPVLFNLKFSQSNSTLGFLKPIQTGSWSFYGPSSYFLDKCFIEGNQSFFLEEKAPYTFVHLHKSKSCLHKYLVIARCLFQEKSNQIKSNFFPTINVCYFRTPLSGSSLSQSDLIHFQE